MLLAYAVDLGEWFAIVLNPDLVDRRFFSHSPLLVAVFTVAVCIVLGVYCRLRRPWPFLIIAGVIFSHLLLDFHYVRLGVVEWYHGNNVKDYELSYSATFPAELCVYGGPLVWAVLLRASYMQGCSRVARIVSQVLVILSVAAAYSCQAMIWAPVYTVSVGHGLVLLRRHLDVRLLWNLVPLLPLFALGFTTWLAWERVEQGRLLARQGLDAEAVRVYETALNIPSRSGRLGVYMLMGYSYEKLGELSEAERMYQQALVLCSRPGWPETAMADFYVRHRGTPFYRPEQALAHFTRLLETDGTDADVQAYARERLRQLRKRGVIPKIVRHERRRVGGTSRSEVKPTNQGRVQGPKSKVQSPADF